MIPFYPIYDAGVLRRVAAGLKPSPYGYVDSDAIQQAIDSEALRPLRDDLALRALFIKLMDFETDRMAGQHLPGKRRLMMKPQERTPEVSSEHMATWKQYEMLRKLAYTDNLTIKVAKPV